MSNGGMALQGSIGETLTKLWTRATHPGGSCRLVSPLDCAVFCPLVNLDDPWYATAYTRTPSLCLHSVCSFGRRTLCGGGLDRSSDFFTTHDNDDWWYWPLLMDHRMSTYRSIACVWAFVWRAHRTTVAFWLGVLIAISFIIAFLSLLLFMYFSSLLIAQK